MPYQRWVKELHMLNIREISCLTIKAQNKNRVCREAYNNYSVKIYLNPSQHL